MLLETVTILLSCMLLYSLLHCNKLSDLYCHLHRLLQLIIYFYLTVSFALSLPTQVHILYLYVHHSLLCATSFLGTFLPIFLQNKIAPK